MSKSILRIVCGLLIMLVFVGGLAACGDDDTPSGPDYADEMVESTAQAFSDGDYAAFTQYLTPEIKEALTENIFNQASQLLKSIIGDYIDKEFLSTQTIGTDTVVSYRVRFTDEPDEATLTVLFTEIEGEIYIASFTFDSPKLREAAAVGQ